jgi:molybdopterin-guanine dinucleotide biosynthesis protein B
LKRFGIIGASGSGKTTLIAALLPALRARGLRVSTVKHAHHGFDMDRPGKDSWRHRAAGAEEVMVVSAGRWALLREMQDHDEVGLDAILARMSAVDLVLIEGFRKNAMPKLEVYRPSLGKPPFYPTDPGITAVASDAPGSVRNRHVLPLFDVPAIADFILSEAAPISRARELA